jgi:N-acetylmuramoyl-L-alanine amidase
MNKWLIRVVFIFSCLLYFKTNARAESALPQAGYPAWAEEYESTIKYTEPEEPQRYYLTAEDEDLLLRVSVLEAGPSDPVGIAYVMQTVLNRVESDLFPNSIREVIFQPKQFATANRLGEADITEAAGAALEAIIWGDYVDMRALYFESLPGIAWGGCHEYLFSYGGHDFYDQ